jgi:hypothetical protein
MRSEAFYQSGGAKTEGASMKIQLPIDMSAVSFIDMMPAEPVLDHLTKPHKADANGEPLYSIEVACIGEGGGEILSVKFPRTPQVGIRQGMPARVTALMVTDRSIGDRFGFTFRATNVEPLSAADTNPTGHQTQQRCATGSNR